MTTKTLNEHIVATPGVLGGKPRIAGRRISVQHVVTWHEQMGWSADYIASEFDLSLADIYAALAYYYDHKEELDARKREDDAFVEEMMRQNPSKISPKSLRRRGQLLPAADPAAWAAKDQLSWWPLFVAEFHERRD
jgi:uncharacterized protein (DUF433 family)